jgi:hypothetical protein
MRDGKIALVVDTKLTVEPGAFAIGQEVRDILWPPTCTVLRIDKAALLPKSDHGIAEGDVVHLHYQTLDPDHTLACLEQILGRQTKQTKFRSHIEKKNEEITNQ